MNNRFEIFTRFLIMFLLAVAVADCAGMRPWPPDGERAKPAPPVTRPAESEAENGATGKHFTGVYHTVKKGQTLWRIAKTYGVDLETLQWVNDVEDVTNLRVGRVLFIPGAEKVMEIIPIRPEDEIPPAPGRIAIEWPIHGRITSGFGLRGKRIHEGIDIAAPTGTRVEAAAAGRIVYSGSGMKGYGKVVVVKHENDFSTVYAHNSALLVKMGERVDQGEVIARVGATGWATGPHLHFEVRRRGVPEDPMDYLPSL